MIKVKEREKWHPQVEEFDHGFEQSGKPFWLFY